LPGLVFCLSDALLAGSVVDTSRTSHNQTSAKWIWIAGEPDAPANRFTYFRKVVTLGQLPSDLTIHFAADSNAHLWVNGHILRRKVTRYFEEKITSEVIDATPALKVGENVIVVLHHN
jgi:hypothetical protein